MDVLNNSGTLTNKSVCRLCLAIDIRMFILSSSSLQHVYEKITDIKLNQLDEKQSMCYICHARLKQCYNLIQQAKLTDELLKKASVNRIELNNIAETQLYKLSQSSIVYTSFDPLEIEVEIKEEQVKEESELGIKEDSCNSENAIDSREAEVIYTESNNQDFDGDDYVTDSEDDVPLKSIRSKRKANNNAGSKNNVKRRKLYKKENFESQAVYLDKNQQMTEFLERAKSLNYLNSPYKCDLCYKGFLDPTAYTNHKEKHAEINGPYKCDICQLRYGTRKSLNTHTAASHARRFACRLCSHTAHTKNQAIVHEKWHNGHRYPCKLCGKEFSKPTTYLSHMRKLHAHCSEHICRQCGESFAGKHGLMMHRSKTHKHDAPEPKMEADCTLNSHCKDCEVQFVSQDAYNLHLLTSGKHKQTLWKDNGSTCSICGARVGAHVRAKHARAHVRQLRAKRAEHVPAAPAAVLLPCDRCDKSFTSQSKLHTHVKRMHLGQRYNKNVVCEVCGKHCTSYAALSYHQRRHTGERPFACGDCAARFASREHLRVHARTHSGERPYACALCARRFAQKPALNKHYAVHTGAKPYECHLCNKTFSQSGSMKKHIKSVHLRQPVKKKKNEAETTEKTNLETIQ